MNDLGLLIKSINDKIRTFADDEFSRYGLTSVQASYLQYIERQGGRTYQKELEAHFKVSHPTVIGIVSRLEEKGFIRIETDPVDHRNRIIQLCDKAVQLHQQMKDGQVWIEKQMTNGLDDDDINTIYLLLGKIDQNLSNVGKGDNE